MSSDENVYVNVEISSTETNTDYESDDSIGELPNSSDDTSINLGDVNKEENKMVVEGERPTEDDDNDLDGKCNILP